MSAVCPSGHTSDSEDYCDVCGMPIDASAVTPAAESETGSGESGQLAPQPDPSTQPCPNCSTPNVPDALFCENCGYDFTTGTMPRPLTAPENPAPDESAPDLGPPDTSHPEMNPPDVTPPGVGAVDLAPTGAVWVAELWIDPAWYQAQESTDPLPSPGLPEITALRTSSALIGRVSQSRNIHPEIDCDTDSGVSRRQAQLTTDGSRWWVEDLDSANGTFVAAATDALPETPIAVGVKRELGPDDRIYLGAWTRIVVRAATEGETSIL